MVSLYPAMNALFLTYNFSGTEWITSPETVAYGKYKILKIKPKLVHSPPSNGYSAMMVESHGGTSFLGKSNVRVKTILTFSLLHFKVFCDVLRFGSVLFLQIINLSILNCSDKIDKAVSTTSNANSSDDSDKTRIVYWFSCWNELELKKRS